MADFSRRGLLTGSFRRSGTAFRPPWSGDENHFLVDCTRCDTCLSACETRVLKRGQGGYPEVNFDHGECTFCYACAQACPEQLFLARDVSPWEHTLSIGDNCLAKNSIECRSCQDTCDTQAISFRPSLQGIAQPLLNHTDCTACGACISGCPVSAIKMRHANAS
ncbi:ferredoxin-type protein NapF [Buttiauxella sp. S04-F03]|uniref:ferredoxin-type protein NapF n=1 Tax=Buttiauxella sp. W03-F01 TaxID=2904524 RepID=UPI001E2E33FB|nr:ferredoxin-type protein NapF [Buttiauxella sp. W03-F01]MCE0801872.1 ferredoxin-type protein NapF [Buttiauxella sp. W03-F01]